MSQWPRCSGPQQADQTLGSPLCSSTRLPLDPAVSEHGAPFFSVCVSPALNRRPIETITQRRYRFALKNSDKGVQSYPENQEFSVGASRRLEILLRGCSRLSSGRHAHLKFSPAIREVSMA